MTPQQSFFIYNAIHLHFTSENYDCIKYRYKTRVNEKTFYKRRDKYFFSKVASKYGEDVVDFFVSQYSDGTTDKWVGDMSDDVYVEWMKRRQSFSYRFEQDIKHLQTLSDSFDGLFETKTTTYPPIIQEYVNNNIDPETVVSIYHLTRFCDTINISDPLLWPKMKHFIKKYSSFIEVNKSKIQTICLKYFTH